MGGRPIRGNEWLSTTGHSSCTVCHVEMRIYFVRRKLTVEFNNVFFIFLVSLDFYTCK